MCYIVQYCLPTDYLLFSSLGYWSEEYGENLDLMNYVCMGNLDLMNYVCMENLDYGKFRLNELCVYGKFRPNELWKI